jgi:hypothetical protein
MMAEKPVLNKAAISAATAKKAAATAKATAAKAIGEPIAKKVLPTIPKTAAALNALAKAMQGNDKKAIAKAQADAKAAIAVNKSSASQQPCLGHVLCLGKGLQHRSLIWVAHFF